MAQASSAQREPSMEEILASIRRIIEDSESGRRDDATMRDSLGASAEVENFRAELRPLSRSATGPDEESTSPQSRFDEALEVTDSSEEPDEEQSAMQEAGDDGDDLIVPVAANAPVASSVAPSDAGGWEPRQAMPALQSDAAEQERRGILSELPGRKVAAAFEELNEALLTNRRKTLDQMAEEMLRPMLQDWLDNNLPHLVERLVREEIERIARGT